MISISKTSVARVFEQGTLE